MTTVQKPISTACETCPAHHAANLLKLGVNMEDWDYVVALAGNPNTGKSTVFNALTGLRQHTGNWPGKTVSRAEGGYRFNDRRYKLIDLPGTYSLLSAAQDEEIARDFILFGQPDCTIVVTDATCLERNLNLVLQVLGQHVQAAAGNVGGLDAPLENALNQGRRLHQVVAVHHQQASLAGGAQQVAGHRLGGVTGNLMNSFSENFL